jgi:glycosyltransferase involved in cell wall biosynthesis
MKDINLQHSNLRKIALVGNHLPRKCGIATFTTDLLNALTGAAATSECWAAVMNDTAGGYRYPPQVRFEVNQRTIPDYRLMAEFLNMNRVDVVCLQHEFGIFGGNDGEYIIEALENLRMPVVTTLHTVLQDPSPGQEAVMKRISWMSARLIVMSARARNILKDVFNVPDEKIAMIHHGIPDVAFVDPNYYKDQFGVEGKKVLLTFGLLSPGKGIETMIEALPEVVNHHPDIVYIVLGATHPHVRKEQGESYRDSLRHRARELGVDKHLVFHDRFVELNELCEFLGAADLYITPYLNKEQIVSGTLAYALGAGKATVSTPYWYAEEMLADGRGRIVPFKDPEALAAQINDLLANEVERHAMRKRAYTFCRQMAWKEVARQYLDVFSDAKKERERKPREVFKVKTMKAIHRQAPSPDLSHITRLTDDVGILQHARFTVPNRFHGYCTDDNARALIAVLRAQHILRDLDRIPNYVPIYMSFLHHAFNEKTGRFRNFMSYDRRWLEEEGSEDSHGRAVWSLGEAVALARSEDTRGAALDIFEKALPALLELSAPRAWSFALLGIHAYLKKYSGASEIRRIGKKLAEQLFALYRKNASNGWPWFEDCLTYANGKLCHALILSGRSMQREDMLEAGIQSLEWLVEIQTDPRGHFVPVGNNGWHHRDKEKARFDQQPIEALDMIEACQEAHQVAREAKWSAHARQCLEWYLGRNDLDAPLYDPETGGCRDGLTANGPNRNQGAEATLCWFLSLLSHCKSREAPVESPAQVEAAERGGK